MANVPRVINLASSLLLKSAPYPVRSLIFIANLDFTNPFRVEKQSPSVQLQAFRKSVRLAFRITYSDSGNRPAWSQQASFITTGARLESAQTTTWE